MSEHLPTLAGEYARLSWPTSLAVDQARTATTVRWQVSLDGPVVLPWPTLDRPEPQRLSLHDLRQTRQPKRSQSWRAVAARPQLVSLRHTREQWRVRLGWYTGPRVRWVELTSPRATGDGFALLPGGLALPATGARVALVVADVRLVAEPAQRTQPNPSFLRAGDRLAHLTATVRTQEARLGLAVAQLEQSYIQQSHEHARHQAPSKL